MKNLLKRAGKVAQNPALRPLEVWAIRAVLGIVAVKLGIDLETLVN